MPVTKPNNYVLRFLQGSLLAWLALSFWAQNNLGLADNGDYSRFMTIVTRGPVGIEPNWPPAGTPEWSQRFFNNWLPYWHLDVTLQRPVTSVALFWLAGALVNVLSFSSSVLWLPLLGLPIKVLLAALVVLLFVWIEWRAPRHKLLLTLALGCPLVLLLSTTDYVIFINTFYREAGSVAYLLAFLASLLFLMAHPTSRTRWWLCLGLLVLLTTAKASNFFWPALGVPLLFVLPTGKPAWRQVPAGLALIMVLSLGSMRFMSEPANYANVWNSLFSSALLVSRQPERHLQRLNMPDAVPCIGRPIWLGVGQDCYRRFGDQVTLSDTLRVVLWEPTIVVRQLKLGLDAMNDLSLELHGIYAADDPRGQAVPAVEGPIDRPFWGTRSNLTLNFWSKLQFHLFPRGWPLLMVLVLLSSLWRVGFRQGGPAQDIAVIGALVTAAVLLDLLVQMVGEGTQDLTKHLFMANILFDLAVFAAAGVVALTLAEWLRAYRTPVRPLRALYRLQTILFALRRYLPGPVRQVLKPIYRRWWQRAALRRRAQALTARPAPDTVPGYAVVCLAAIDWELRFQRPQQLLSRLGQAGHLVYYLRTDFAAGRAADPLEPLAPNVYGLRLPGPSRLDLYQALPAAEWVARWVEVFEALSRSQPFTDAVILVQSPFWAPLALALRQRLHWPLVYDCLDEHAGFASNAPAVVAGEAALVAESDLVLATARLLYERCAPLARRCLRLPNAADVDHFEQAVPHPTQLPRPIVGYYGALAEWFEAGWIEAAARAHPAWSFVLIGLNSGMDLRRLERLPNVYLLGEQPYEALPAWLHAFDVAVIPFMVNPLTRATNPVKFYEYMAAGKPVVATALPELDAHVELFYPARDQAEFLQQLSAAAAERDPAAREARVAFARANAWPARVADFEREVTGLFGEAVIILISYNNREYLQLCLESLWAQTQYPRFRVVVVDNASGPDVVDYLHAEQARQPRLSVIFNSENVGFAHANNQGLATAAAAEFVVLLNDDTVVTRGWLSRLLHHLRADPTLGMVGPLTNWASNGAKISPGYEHPDLGGLEAFAARQTARYLGQVHDTPRLDMFCVALRRKVANEVGPLDEAYGLGMFEDDDYALRLSRAGYRLGIAADVYIHHWGWASFGRLDQAAYDHVFEANRRYFEEKWMRRWQRPPLNLKAEL